MMRIIRQHPIVAYFVMTYLISWLGALLVAAPTLLRGQALGQLQGILMFPALLLGPSITGIVMTVITQGRAGLRQLGARMVRWRVGGQWWAVALLLPPVVMLATLLGLRALVSPVFTPTLYPYGPAFGLIAGFLEEIGWTGFVFPLLRAKRGQFAGSVILGVFWGAWHLPVVDFLGAAWPHGSYWAAFAVAFIVAMTAMRVLIAWVVSNAKDSVLLAQVMHASSTACLATLGPHPITAAQEALWYAVYAGALWLVAILVTLAGTTRASAKSAEPSVPHAA
jgi:membrane protease YdiL (CAAX protease family)